MSPSSLPVPAPAPAAAATPQLHYELLQHALHLAQEAGKVIRSTFHSSSKRTSSKGADIDLVTESDQQCERLICAGIQQRYPDHHFLGEEAYAEQTQNSTYTTGSVHPAAVKTYGLTDTSTPTWIVDPIDGTTNFVHSIPHVCVSIGVWIHMQPCVAVVYNPILDEAYTAIAGEGAYLTTADNTRTKLSVSSITSLNQSIIIQEFGYDRSAEGVGEKLRILQELTVKHTVRALRFFGSCALNMCYVAAGKCEGYHEGINTTFGPKPWDTAAAALIVTEAGGIVSDVNGQPFDICNGRMLCANNQQTLQQLVQVIAHEK